MQNSNSLYKLGLEQQVYNNRKHNDSLGSTVSSANSQCYIRPLELRNSPLYFSKTGDKKATYRNYVNTNSSEPPPLMPRPIPFTPVQAAPPPLPQRVDHQVPGLLVTNQTMYPTNPPFLPPKQHQPPPYRPPPNSKNQISGLSQPGPMEPPQSSLVSNSQMLSPTNRLLMMPPIEEDVSYMSQEPLIAKSNSSKLRIDDRKLSSAHQNSSAEIFPPANVTGASSSNLANNGLPSTHVPMSGIGCGGSSDGGGSHDSHNDSGYCVGSSSNSGRFGSGGPSPSLSGNNL